MRLLSDSRLRILLVIAIACLVCMIAVMRISREKLQIHGSSDKTAERSIPAELRTNAKPAIASGNPGVTPFVSSVRPPFSPTESQGHVLPQGRAIVEFCYVDQDTQRPVTSGRLTIRAEQLELPVFDAAVGGDGCNLLEMDPGKYRVRVDCSGYSKRDESIEILSQLDRVKKTILLSKTIKVRGIVRNSRGQPQAGANIEFIQEGFRASAQSGLRGEFEALLQIQPIKKLFAYRPPHPAAELGPILIQETNNPYLEITLPKDAPALILRGKVFDDQGRPMEGAAIEVHTNAGYSITEKEYAWMEPWLQHQVTHSNAEGVFSLELPKPCKAWLTVLADNLESYRETLEISKDLDKNVYLTRHRLFDVKVRDVEGNDIQGISVMGLSPDGTEVLQAAKENGKYYSTEYPFTIFGRGIMNNLGFTKVEWIDKYRDEIVLTLGQCAVQGRATDEMGNPIKAFSVGITYSNNESYKSYLLFRGEFPNTFYSEDGQFVLKNLLPGRASILITASSALGDWEPFMQEVIVTEGRAGIIRAVMKRK